MAMNVGQETEGGEEVPMSEINVTPMVDVMLVLMFIFLITIQVVIQTVQATLPEVRFEPTTTKPENVSLGPCQRSGRMRGLLEPPPGEFRSAAQHGGGQDRDRHRA